MNLVEKNQKQVFCYRQINTSFERNNYNENYITSTYLNKKTEHDSGDNIVEYCNMAPTKDYRSRDVEKEITVDKSTCLKDHSVNSRTENIIYKDSINEFPLPNNLKTKKKKDHLLVSSNSFSSMESNYSKESKSLRSIYQFITHLQNDQKKITSSMETIPKNELCKKFLNNNYKQTSKPTSTINISDSDSESKSESSRSPKTVVHQAQNHEIENKKSLKNKIISNYFSKNSNHQDLAIDTSYLSNLLIGLKESNNITKVFNFDNKRINKKKFEKYNNKEIGFFDKKDVKFGLVQNSFSENRIVKNQQSGLNKKKDLMLNIDKHYIENPFRTLKESNQEIDKNEKLINHKLRKVKEWLIGLESFRFRSEILNQNGYDLRLNTNTKYLKFINGKEHQNYLKIHENQKKYGLREEIK